MDNIEDIIHHFHTCNYLWKCKYCDVEYQTEKEVRKHHCRTSSSDEDENETDSDENRNDNNDNRSSEDEKKEMKKERKKETDRKDSHQSSKVKIIGIY